MAESLEEFIPIPRRKRSTPSKAKPETSHEGCVAPAAALPRSSTENESKIHGLTKAQTSENMAAAPVPRAKIANPSSSSEATRKSKEVATSEATRKSKKEAITHSRTPGEESSLPSSPPSTGESPRRSPRLIKAADVSNPSSLRNADMACKPEAKTPSSSRSMGIDEPSKPKAGASKEASSISVAPPRVSGSSKTKIGTFEAPSPFKPPTRRTLDVPCRPKAAEIKKQASMSSPPPRKDKPSKTMAGTPEAAVPFSVPMRSNLQQPSKPKIEIIKGAVASSPPETMDDSSKPKAKTFGATSKPYADVPRSLLPIKKRMSRDAMPQPSSEKLGESSSQLPVSKKRKRSIPQPETSSGEEAGPAAHALDKTIVIEGWNKDQTTRAWAEEVKKGVQNVPGVAVRMSTERKDGCLAVRYETVETLFFQTTQQSTEGRSIPNVKRFISDIIKRIN